MVGDEQVQVSFSSLVLALEVVQADVAAQARRAKVW
jgi:hypothetical protein